MRPLTFWIGQFLLAAGTMFLLLAAIDLMRGDSLAATWAQTLAWSVAAAAIFVGARWRQASQGAECALCKDDPPR
jgi:multisubunit Na+/H+ antiporter MnhG subunit